MFDTITFRAGPIHLAPSLQLVVAPITLFVGPNNSGKSQVLIELEELMAASGVLPNGKIVIGASYISLTKEEAEQELQSLSTQEAVTDAALKGKPLTVVIDAVPEMYRVIDAFNLLGRATGEEKIYGNLLSLHTLRLDGQRRLSLLEPQQMGDLQSPPTNYLTHLFRHNILRERVSQSVYNAIGRFFVLDVWSRRMGEGF